MRTQLAPIGADGATTAHPRRYRARAGAILKGSKLKVSELTGAALDWAVAKCEGLPVEKNRAGTLSFDAGLFPTFSDIEKGRWQIYRPSTDWAQGGPIIEREEIELRKWAVEGWKAHATNYTFLNTPAEKPEFAEQYGLTPLIAAMRCYVASRLGDEIYVPTELTLTGN